MLAQQAIFTSAQTGQGDGYQLVARSPGLGNDDARELCIWCPSHDALLEPDLVPVSVNFHPLPSGAYCISRTTQAGGEYSGRAGPRLHTHCLVVPPELFARFANNAFDILRAAVAGGLVRPGDRRNEGLKPARLVGRARAVDRTQLTRIVRLHGPAWLAAALDAGVTRPRLGIVCSPHTERIMRGLVACLPVACRPKFSFSTGLRYSLRRPFRWIAVARDPARQRHLHSQYDVTTVAAAPSGETTARPPACGWARFVAAAAQAGGLTTLEAKIQNSPAGLTIEGLDRFGQECLRELEPAAMRN